MDQILINLTFNTPSFDASIQLQNGFDLSYRKRLDKSKEKKYS